MFLSRACRAATRPCHELSTRFHISSFSHQRLRYATFVEQRRRVLSEQLSASDWFVEVPVPGPRPLTAATPDTDRYIPGNRNETSPRASGPTNIGSYATTPPKSVALSRGRKTMSPTEVREYPARSVRPSRRPLAADVQKPNRKILTPVPHTRACA